PPARMPVSTSSSDSRLPTTAVSTASSTAVAAREASAGLMGLGWVICPFLVTEGRGGVSASRRLYVTQLACGGSAVLARRITCWLGSPPRSSAVSEDGGEGIVWRSTRAGACGGP